MGRSLEQYVDNLHQRPDLTWPLPPPVQPPSARPHLIKMPKIRVVLWSLYGTLLRISAGRILHEHPEKFIMETALEKTVQEFRMWQSMTRKPGQPSEYLQEMYQKVLFEQRAASPAGERFPEVHSPRLWEAIVKKLEQKGYAYEASLHGPPEEFCKKIAYFFHASLQGTACYDHAGSQLERLARAGIQQGLMADAQCFSLIQLKRGLKAQGCTLGVDQLFAPSLVALSCDVGGQKPSQHLFRPVVMQLLAMKVAPMEVLHIGSRLEQDIAPAKKLGMRTALFAGDKESMQATPELMKNPQTRPDVLLTDLSQLGEIVGC